MKRLLRNLIRRTGYDLVRYAPSDPLLAAFPDLSESERQILRRVQPFTMTSPERLVAVINAIRFIHEKGIPGDIVECGVWRGGSMMTAALMLQLLGDTSRHLHLYDTFEGMSSPTEKDESFDGRKAGDLLDKEAPQTGIWCYADLQDVQANLSSTGYPEKCIHYHKGKVEDTIPAALPGSIALLRLDTDWYESTRHELEHLYPRLRSGGLLIIDDYGHWQGARRAVDDYFVKEPTQSYLHRVDYTGRLLQKP